MLTHLAERAARGAQISRLLPQLVELAGRHAALDGLLPAALEMLAQAGGLEFLGLVQGTKGQWRTLHHAGEAAPLPAEWLSEILDREQAGEQSPWIAAPLETGAAEGLLLLGRGRLSLNEFDSLAAALALVRRTFLQRLQEARRANRLQALLDIAIRWREHHETGKLLHLIAETSTQLLDAERATIFLLDETRNLLVGKPALGVASGELLIPRDVGVVGRAIETGQPQRVDADIAAEQALVDRQVDEKLKFKTQSLLCVPLRNAEGRVIGAFELINKRNGTFSDADESDLIELARHAAVAIGNSQHVAQLVESRKQVAEQAAEKVKWVGNSPQILKIKDTIERVAGTELAILITGENGTGKEIVAQMIHYLSDRRDQVLVAVNCAAIAETLLESELFGHEKGAFTDAHQTRPGKFELASRGTLFLDEIGDMSLAGQAKLLRVLEEKVVVRVGGSTPIPTQARVVAATNQNLAQLVREKRFREDLFFRLNVVTIELPPLRDRGDDCLELAEHFLRIFSVNVRRKVPMLTDSAKRRLAAHAWPGNVRELRNMMERIAYLSTGDRVEASDLQFINSPRDNDATTELDDLPLSAATDRFQEMYINRQIQRARGNMTEAARQMGLHRSNLYRKMKQLGMDTGD